MLKREDILNKSDIKEEVIEVPEWGGKIKVKSLSGDEYVDLVEACMVQGGLSYKLLYPMLIQVATIEPEFEKGDVDSLRRKNAGALERICKEILDLSGIDMGGNLKNL